MNEKQTEFDQLKERLLNAREQLQTNAPDWDSIPVWKIPTEAAQFAKQQTSTAQQVAEDTIAIVLNLDARLRAGGL